MPDPAAAASRVASLVPEAVGGIIATLNDGGHAAYAVGGCIRDVILGLEPVDWDLATDALPERMLQLFPAAVYENAFGTVAIRRGDELYQVTTFREDHDYADFRRPHRLEFGIDLWRDLARRDFTVNAIAWGRAPDDQRDVLVDPLGGLQDIENRLLRAVGDPDARFGEDALRMVRAVRLAATRALDVEPATLAAMTANAPLVTHLSGERIGLELTKLLAADAPSRGLRIAQDTGLLAVISPELGAQRGVPQNKVDGEDLWDHTLRAVDAVPRDRPVVRLAALLHDIGKPATLADGHFHHHDVVGAEQAETLLRRLRIPRAVIDEVVHLIRHHMFTIEPTATDAAIRRFIKRIGPDRIDALFALRRADDIGSGLVPDRPALVAFRRRIDAELAAEAALDRYSLEIDGNDLMRDLGLAPGPRVGRILDELVERVIADPALNEAPTLLLLAQGMLADMQDGGAR